MSKRFEAPTLRRFGVVSSLTASDFKCTPGADGGFTYWDHTPNPLQQDDYIAVAAPPGTGYVAGSETNRKDMPSTCRGVTAAERLIWDIDTSEGS